MIENPWKFRKSSDIEMEVLFRRAENVWNEAIVARDKWWREKLKLFKSKLKVSCGIIYIDQEALFELDSGIFPILAEVDKDGKVLNPEQLKRQQFKATLEVK